jgi:hypothetical protein
LYISLSILFLPAHGRLKKHRSRLAGQIEFAKRLVMTTTNRYVKRSKIFEAKFREFVQCSFIDLEAHKIALLAGLNRNNVEKKSSQLV